MRTAPWLTALTSALALAIAVPAAAATPPEILNYQGVLRDATGTPLSGDYSMIFRLVDAVGAEILVDDQTGSAAGGGVTVVDGLFSARIGTGIVSDGSGPGTYTSLSEVFRDYNDVLLSVEVNGELLTPSIPIASTAFALNATHFDGLITEQLLRSDQDDVAFGKIWFAGDPVSSSVGGGPLFVSPSAANPDETLMGLAVSFVEKFRVDAEGDTFIGPNLSMGNGARMWDNGFGLQVYAGDADTDDIFLRAGNSSDDGALTIVGAGQMELKAGNGNFDFVSGSSGVSGRIYTNFNDLVLAADYDASSSLSLVGGPPGNTSRITLDGGGDISLLSKSGYFHVGDSDFSGPARFLAEHGPLSFRTATYHSVILDTDADQDMQARWWKDGGIFTSDQIAELQETGDFRIAGSYSNNVAFDVAETFLAAERVEPGDVVRVDPSRADAVRLAADPEDTAVLGIVSTKPGLLLGGAPFWAEGIEEVWGKEVQDEYFSRRDILVGKVLSSHPDLQSRLEQAPPWNPPVAVGRGAGPSGAEERRRDAGEERFEIEKEIEDLSLKMFFEERFARVALAGRVPVKVDAGYGSIRAGDLLTSSPTPGHAMRADDPKPGTIIGKALEGLDAGTGKIRALVMLR